MKELEKYDWPEVKQVDMAFPTFKADPVLLALAEKKKYEKGRKAFSRAFFAGGKVKFAHELAEWEKKAFIYMRSFMKSWGPKHEHKEAICAMIFEELGITVE